MFKIFNSFVALFVSVLLVVQPFCLNARSGSFPIIIKSSTAEAADGIVVDQGAAVANRASMDSAQNGVPVVNIVAPTAGGVSANKFSEFNVDSRGVIMNNSLVMGVSQLGGALVGNPNFTTHQSARIILNEVTGSNRSELKGATEIFGDKAAYVLANPNGITCNGCGFINTPRVTLSTGTPQMTGGNLVGFDVNGGDVLFEGLDVNATNVDSFDIITRTAKFTAALHAGEINVITGRNTVDYATKVATAKADDGSAKPTLAIDSSALGGMYAGKIGLVATEAGVGVKTDGKLAASASDVVITADGRIELKSVNAAKDIKIKSANAGVKKSGDSYSGGNTKIEAKGAVELQDGFTAAGRDINIYAEDDILTDNFVLAGVDVSQAGNDVTFSNNGNGNLLFNAGGNITNTSQITGNNLSLTSGGSINNTNAVIAANGTLSLDAATITNTNGLIQSNGDMQLSANSIDNNSTYITDLNGNIIYGIISNGNLDISSGSLGNNNGAVVAGGTANLNITTLDNSAGLLLANGKFDITGDDVNNNSGAIVGGGTSITANTIDNTSGLLSSFGDMTLDAATAVNNYLGTIYAKGDFTATNVNNNNGIIQTEGKISIDNNGAVLDNTLGNIRALGATSSIAIIGLTNLFNLGGNIIAQANIDINVSNNYVVNGDIITNDHVDITAWSVTNNATINAVDYIAFTLTQGGFTNSAGAEVISNTSVVIDVQGAGSVANNGEISAPVIDITTANGNLTNASSGVISSSGTLDIDVNGSITNAGRISADGNATIDSITYNNTGQTASDNNLTITTSGNSIHNTGGGLLYATNDLFLHTSLLENNASEIFSFNGDITIDKTAGVKNISVTNTSGSIEAMSGDVRIDTDSLINNRSSYATVAPHRLDSDGDIIVFSGAAEGSTPSVDLTGYTQRYRIDYNDSAHDTFYIYRGTGTMGISSSILAANDININAGSVLNDGSLIAAGRDVNIVAASVINKARDASDWAYLMSWRDSHPGWYGSLYVSDYSPTKFTSYNLQPHTAPASIIAGRNLNATVQNIDNATSTSGGAAPVIIAANSNTTSTSTNPDVSPLALVDDGSVSYSNSAALDTSMFGTIPTGTSGLFALSTNPASNYFIETNVAFIDLTRFKGSDYFLTRIGYALPNDVKLLGDAFYETKLVRSAIFERTGQRYLTAGIGTDLDQMQALMDNAFNQMAGLGLTVGIELTATQIAALSSDIMWLVEDEVDGQKVLKPVVYLAQATIDALDGHGAKIIAGNNATITASNTLKNSGLILAGNDLTANVTNDITNYGKIKAGRDISLTSTTGSINNLATVNRASSGTYIVETLAGQGSIESGRDTTLNAVDDINVVGSNIDAGRNLAMTAGNDINVTTDTLHNHDELHAKRATKINDKVENIGSTITSGGNTTATAANNINVLGSTINATGDVILNATNDVTIQAAQNSEEHISKVTKKDVFGSTVTSRNTLDITHTASEISGNNVTINSGGNTLVIGSEIAANTNTNINAGGQVVIASVTDVHEVHEYKKRSSSFVGKWLADDGWGTGGRGKDWKTTHDVSTSTQVGSDVNAGNDLSTGSGGDTYVVASHLGAGGNINITSGGKVALLSAKNTEFVSDTKESESTSWQSQSGSGHSSEEIVHTTIDAGTLNINAAQGIEVDVKKLGTVQESVEELSKQPGLEYLAQLQGRNDVTFNQVNAAYKEWDYSSQGLTPAAAVIIAIIVTIVSMGTAGPAAFATAAGTAASSAAAAAGASAAVAAAAGAAASAAVASLASTALVSTINNQGDIGAVLKEMGSDEYVKSLAITVVTAGATSYAGDTLGYANAANKGVGTAANQTGALTSHSLDWGQHATQIAANSVIGAGVETVINGEGLDHFGDELIDRAKTGAIVAAGSEITAEFIGKPYHIAEYRNGGDAPFSADAWQMAGHAAVGCAMGAAIAGNCGAGAAGAVAGELGAEWTGNSDAGKIISAASGMVSGGDAESVNIANLTGSNAIQNNLLYKNLVPDNEGKELYNNYGPRWIDPKTGKVSSVYEEGYILRKTQHNGTDIASIEGTPIYAAANGVVTKSSPATGYGNTVIIETKTQDGQSVWSIFGHLYQPSNLKVGDTVMEGQIIGVVGNTGVGEGPHLHYGINTGVNGNFNYKNGWINPQGVNIGNYTNLQDTPAYNQGKSSIEYYNQLGK